MAITATTPVSGSTVAHGDSFSFTIDNTYTTLQIKVQTETVLAKAYDTALGGAQAGYTVTVTPVGGTDVFTVARDAGWNKSPQLIYVEEDETGTLVTTNISYSLASEQPFPQGSQPYNPTASSNDYLPYSWLPLTGAGAPGVSTGDGKQEGHVYIDTDADAHYVLTDATAGANVWDSGGGGSSDHGALTGLADDDHTQYHNNARGDARYGTIGDVGLNTTHRTSDGKNHSDVVANNAKISYTDAAAVGLNTTHRTSDGKNHSDVVANNAKISYTDAAAVGLNTTHRTSTGADHSDVVTNTARAPLSGAGVPGVSTGDGKNVGHVYVDTTADVHYVLVDATVGANVWDSGGGGSGDVVGPASAVDDRIATFDLATGKLIQDSGIGIAAVVLNTAKISYTDAAAVGLNTTHRTSDGKDHSDVVANNAKISYTDAAAVGLNTTHRTSSGADHANVVTNTARAPLSGAGVPGVSTGDGKLVGHVYVDTTADKHYVLVDATVGANVWDSGSGGVTDHGALTGLADDDHTQYSLVTGTRAFTGPIEIDSATAGVTTGEHSTSMGTPAAGKVNVYAKADGLMYSKDDAGVETLMSSGAGGGASFTPARMARYNVLNFSPGVSDPGTNNIQPSSSTPASVTSIVYNDLNENSVNIDTLWRNISGAVLVLQKTDDPTEQHFYSAGAVTDVVSAQYLALSYLGSTGGTITSGVDYDIVLHSLPTTGVTTFSESHWVTLTGAQTKTYDATSGHQAAELSQTLGSGTLTEPSGWMGVPITKVMAPGKLSYRVSRTSGTGTLALKLLKQSQNTVTTVTNTQIMNIVLSPTTNGDVLSAVINVTAVGMAAGEQYGIEVTSTATSNWKLSYTIELGLKL